MECNFVDCVIPCLHFLKFQTERNSWIYDTTIQTFVAYQDEFVSMTIYNINNDDFKLIVSISLIQPLSQNRKNLKFILTRLDKS